MQLFNNKGELTQWGLILGDMLFAAKGRSAARLTRQAIKEYGERGVTKLVKVITEGTL